MSSGDFATLFIEPGSPWENGYCESFNGKLRDELLNDESFDAVFLGVGLFSSFLTTRKRNSEARRQHQVLLLKRRVC